MQAVKMKSVEKETKIYAEFENSQCHMLKMQTSTSFHGY